MITIEVVVVEECKVEVARKSFVRSINRAVRWLSLPDLYGGS